MIESAEMFTADECAQIALTVEALRPFWEKTTPFGRTYVLGAASYVHANGPAGPAYHDRRRRLAPVMHDHLAWMYERVLRTLEGVLGGPARIADGLAPPGFHLYIWDPTMHLLRPSVHLDLQWKSHDFARYGAPDLARPVSFTTAIRAPATGAGMNAWNIDVSDPRARRDGAGRRLFESFSPRYVRYQLGALTTHSGLFFHQIAPIELVPGEWRLTLQGHAIRCDDTWQVYW